MIGMKLLLIEPDFPIPPKSRNHKNFLPNGLLKLAAYHREEGSQVKLIRGCKTDLRDIRAVPIGRWYIPDEIWITSLFTYWIPYVRDCVDHYRKLYSKHKLVIKVGGVAASLFGVEETKRLTGCDEVHLGTYKEAENVDTMLLKKEYETYVPEVDFQILHSQRGCERHCPFCGTWKVEPEFTEIYSIKDRIFKKKLVFYDNNFLADKDLVHTTRAEKILDELIELKKEKKILWCESQSGFDGRLLLENPAIAKKIKRAGFRYPRIAWDWGLNQHKKIKEQIETLKEAGYQAKEISVFVLYNWDIPFEEMEEKRKMCFKWGVQISDCRFRPLNQDHDDYNPRKSQDSSDYFINEEKGWTDEKIKTFRRHIRMQNICVRHGFPFYSKAFEHKSYGKEIMRKVKRAKTMKEKKEVMDDYGVDYWVPNE